MTMKIIKMAFSESRIQQELAVELCDQLHGGRYDRQKHDVFLLT